LTMWSLEIRAESRRKKNPEVGYEEKEGVLEKNA